MQPTALSTQVGLENPYMLYSVYCLLLQASRFVLITRSAKFVGSADSYIVHASGREPTMNELAMNDTCP